jgi:transposase
LWTASGEGFCLFHAADTRGRVELETMLGTEFAGVLSSDDFSVYNGCQVQAQQKCLAHLLRHFKKVLALPGKNNNAAVALWGRQVAQTLIRKVNRQRQPLKT